MFGLLYVNSVFIKSGKTNEANTQKVSTRSAPVVASTNSEGSDVSLKKVTLYKKSGGHMLMSACRPRAIYDLIPHLSPSQI